MQRAHYQASIPISKSGAHMFALVPSYYLSLVSVPQAQRSVEAGADYLAGLAEHSTGHDVRVRKNLYCQGRVQRPQDDFAVSARSEQQISIPLNRQNITRVDLVEFLMQLEHLGVLVGFQKSVRPSQRHNRARLIEFATPYGIFKDLKTFFQLELLNICLLLPNKNRLNYARFVDGRKGKAWPHLIVVWTVI